MLHQQDVQNFEIAPNVRIPHAVLLYHSHNVSVAGDGSACFCISYTLQDKRREDTQSPTVYAKGTVSYTNLELGRIIAQAEEEAIAKMIKEKFNYPPPPPAPEPVLDPETAAMRSAVRTLNMVLEKNPAISPETLAAYLERTFKS